jgi:hypothetical protein
MKSLELGYLSGAVKLSYFAITTSHFLPIIITTTA